MLLKNMPSTVVIKPKPMKTSTRQEQQQKTVEKMAANKQKVTRNQPQTFGCTRHCVHSNRCEIVKMHRPGVNPPAKKKERSSAVGVTAAPKTTTNKKSTRSSSKLITTSSHLEEASQTTQRKHAIVRPKVQCAIQRSKAFTVIPPNPIRRKEILKKAEAELAALEILRLSRAMSYISINPSSVGGCMSLQEVRLKQQQDLQASKRHLQMKKSLIQRAPVILEAKQAHSC